MTFPFAWNDFADQPHNVAPRRERLRHHLNRAGSYLGLAAADSMLVVPALRRHQRLPSKGWAEMIRKVYEIDPMVCPQCCGKMKIIAFLSVPAAF